MERNAIILQQENRIVLPHLHMKNQRGFSYLLSVYERAEEQGLIEKIEPHTTSLMYALGDMLY